MARVPEVTALVDIRLPHTANRTGSPKDIAGRRTAAGATAARRIKAAEAIAPRVTAPVATVHLAIADVRTVVVAATAPRPADRRRTVAVAGPAVALAAAVPADQVVGQATPEDIANSRSKINLLLSMPPLTGRLFFARPSQPRRPPQTAPPRHLWDFLQVVTNLGSGLLWFSDKKIGTEQGENKQH